MEKSILVLVPLLLGYTADLIFADPEKLPHPVKLFGNLIYFGESRLNKPKHRFIKGAFLAMFLVAGFFFVFKGVGQFLLAQNEYLYMAYATVFVFYGLANKGLIQEGQKVFKILNDKGIEAGRTQLSRIVGRDTSNLSAQQIRIAVFETMSENLSDGVVAPLFYYWLGGVEGMMAYKVINTLDSMIGYRNERYEQFGKLAARLDDVANYIPARLTAFLMVVFTFSFRGIQFVFRYGSKHKSPNCGYPEAALAGILDCRFGGPNIYKGQLVEKPFIGVNAREILHVEIENVAFVNHTVCATMIIIITILVTIN